ncbi:crotonobetainyl-CoA:carnitine CoA-transferase CaiB-like acyl-CoA transferase [Tamaricihabitans halophyticus]|uniref:Crotonobetainyl-CoA:carnitine CoA-transferase CaiB-like acyl-CoA transferase n=1 Tax=Tamaricihabitans halophyticus TaxID=1262583 RepID=A0A4R2QT38_9PSEU|nr:CoA transferase [Tamaricihabitans halophyticus]TCP53082.1 crotonobetainyl-CoA:carnitine CoA-transferase CaiB-like acyl-CoA transferase [Tamaricihabitans halophyticus]
MTALPLADVRVLAIEQYGAGPFGSVHLADLGAEIIKVEDPGTGGDVGRHTPPYAEDGDSLFFEAFNRNKRSVALDLNSAAGRAVFDDLVRTSDAVYSNLRGDVPAKMRIRYDDLKHLNPAIVCCSLTGYGMTGPRSAQPGYDYMLQGLAGWMSVTGEPDGPPTKSGLSMVDYSGGFVAANSLLAGIHAARRDGIGMDCDVSLYDTAIGMLTYLATWHLNEGFEPRRTHSSAHPSLVPFQNFRTADAWIVIGCAKQKFWERLVGALGSPAWAAESRFATPAERYAHSTECVGLLEEELRQRDTAYWLKALEAAGVPCAPVNTVPQALVEAHTRARGMVVTTEHPRFGQVKQVGSPMRVGPARTKHQRAPRLGEHNAEVLADLLGTDEATYTELAEAGAFGTDREAVWTSH